MDTVSYAEEMTSDSDDALSWDGDEDPQPRAPQPRDSSPRRVESEQVDSPAVDEGASLPAGWDAVGRGSEHVGRSSANGSGSDRVATDEERVPLSTAMLLISGVVGGVYLLYSIGWVVGGLRLKPLANFFVSDAVFLPWFVLAVAAPALWFLTSWVLTRGRASWVRVCLLLLGIVLLVPWPFVTVGVIGA